MSVHGHFGAPSQSNRVTKRLLPNPSCPFMPAVDPSGGGGCGLGDEPCP